MKKKIIKKPITKDPDQEFEEYFMKTDFGGSGVELLPVEPRKVGRPKIRPQIKYSSTRRPNQTFRTYR